MVYPQERVSVQSAYRNTKITQYSINSRNKLDYLFHTLYFDKIYLVRLFSFVAVVMQRFIGRAANRQAA